MTTNSIMIGAFDDGRQAEEVCPEQYPAQGGLLSDGSHHQRRATGAGNRVELPKCVLSGIRSMFPDANGQYMGHREE
jgi:hypothetical protein